MRVLRGDRQILRVTLHELRWQRLCLSGRLYRQDLAPFFGAKPHASRIRNGRTKVLPFSLGCDIIDEVMAKKNNTKRKLVGLVSEESGVRAYYTKKNTMNTPDKLSLKKYDPVLRKHVLFVETKKNLGRNEVKEKKR